MRYFVGNGEMIPQLDPRIVFTGFLETIGRIISHAFILVGMFPVNICKASWHLMLTGTVSRETIMRSFLGHLTERERNVIEKAIEGKVLSDIDALSFLSVLSSHGCKSSPSAQDRLCTLDSVAGTSLLCKPLFCYEQPPVFFAAPVFGKLNMPFLCSKLLKTTSTHNNGTF